LILGLHTSEAVYLAVVVLYVTLTRLYFWLAR